MVNRLGFDEMIEIIVKEVVKRINSEIQPPKKEALLIFTGAISGCNDALNALKKMGKEGYNFKVVLSESAQQILDQDKIKEELDVTDIYVDGTPENVDYLKRDIDKIVIPTLTRNSAAKIAMGISDTLATYLVSWGIMSNIPIVASIDGCNPQKSKSSAYRDMLNNNIEILKEYGIALKEAKDIYKCEKNIVQCEYKKEKEVFLEKKLITREDVINAKNNNQQILVSKNTIITQLATDIARQIGVTIKTTN